MTETIKHLNGYGHTLCGKKTGEYPFGVVLAESYAEMNCKSCMKTETYQSYLAGKFREKPKK